MKTLRHFAEDTYDVIRDCSKEEAIDYLYEVVRLREEQTLKELLSKPKIYTAVEVRGCDEWFGDLSRQDAEEEAFEDWDVKGGPEDKPPRINEYVLLETHVMDVSEDL